VGADGGRIQLAAFNAITPPSTYMLKNMTSDHHRRKAQLGFLETCYNFNENETVGTAVFRLCQK